jgi:hypothetical protein
MESVEPFPFLPCPPQLTKPCGMGEVPTAGTMRSAAQFRDAASSAGYTDLLFWSSRAGDAFSDLAAALSQLYLGGGPVLYPAVVTGGSFATLAWRHGPAGPPSGGYRLEAKLTPGGPIVASLPLAGSATTFSVSVPPGVFYLAVRAMTPGGPGPVSNESALVIGAPPPPDRPRMLVSAVSGSTISLAWLPAATSLVVPEDSFIVEAGSAQGLSNLTAFDTGTTTGSFAAGGVPPGRYFVRVRARNASGTSGPSNETILSVGVPAVAAPTSLTALVSGNTVTLSWQAPSGGAPLVGYQLEAGSVEGAADLARVPLGITTSVSFPGVPSGTYFVRVVSVDALGPSAASNEVVVIVP